MTACTTFFFAASCSDSKSDPAPAATGIKGSFTPTNGVTTVTATPASGTAVTATPSAGAYTFADLSAGNYTVTYTPASGFEAPASQAVTVTAGQTTEIPAFTVFASNYGGAITFAVNGGTAGTPLTSSASLSSSVLNIYAASFSGQVNLNANGVTGPGTYPISSGMIIVGTSIYNTSAGSMVITAFNATTRRITGTFTASSGSNTTSGTFTDLKLR